MLMLMFDDGNGGGGGRLKRSKHMRVNATHSCTLAKQNTHTHSQCPESLQPKHARTHAGRHPYTYYVAQTCANVIGVLHKHRRSTLDARTHAGKRARTMVGGQPTTHLPPPIPRRAWRAVGRGGIGNEQSRGACVRWCAIFTCAPDLTERRDVRNGISIDAVWFFVVAPEQVVLLCAGARCVLGVWYANECWRIVQRVSVIIIEGDAGAILENSYAVWVCALEVLSPVCRLLYWRLDWNNGIFLTYVGEEHTVNQVNDVRLVWGWWGIIMRIVECCESEYKFNHA